MPDLNQDRLESRIQIESLQARRNRHLLIKCWPDGLLRAYDFSNVCGDYNAINFARQSAIRSNAHRLLSSLARHTELLGNATARPKRVPRAFNSENSACGRRLESVARVGSVPAWGLPS